MIGHVIDGLLALGLLWLGWQVVTGRNLFRSIVLFLVFGLLMAVAWARLRAPDLALAEAAIGAGLTGAMLLATCRRLLEQDPQHALRAELSRSALALPVALLSAALVLLLGWVLVEGLPPGVPQDGAPALVAALMPETGLGNPVTGVLLLFRGYDTLLEMAVLFAAWLGLRTVQPESLPAPALPAMPVPLLASLLSVAVPGALLVAGYLLHAGANAPGGAFQAGAVLAAAGVLLALAGRVFPRPEPGAPGIAALLLGLLVFTLLGPGLLAFGHAALALPGLWAVYLIEGALTLSIGLTLTLLFLGSAGVYRSST